jgi:hypothetical protein
MCMKSVFRSHWAGNDRFFFKLVGWTLGTAATTGLLYQPRMIGDGGCGEVGGMNIGRGNRSTREKTCPSATLSATNPTCLDPVLNQGRHGGKSATKRLSYGAARKWQKLQNYFQVDRLLSTSSHSPFCCFKLWEHMNNYDLKVSGDGWLLCSWTLSIVLSLSKKSPVFSSKHYVSETGFCLRPQANLWEKNRTVF